MRQPSRRVVLRTLALVCGLVLIGVGAFVSLPAAMIRIRVLAILLGVLLYMTALVRPIQNVLSGQRRYAALRQQTDKLLMLVRELNRAALQAQAVGYEQDGYLDPIIREMHKQVDRLSRDAGEKPAARHRPSQ